MGINNFSAEIAIYFVNLTLTKRSHREFEKGLAALLLSHKKLITSGIHKIDEINMSILRDSSSKAITNLVKKLSELEAIEVGKTKDT
jgi:hypothetical protein